MAYLCVFLILLVHTISGSEGEQITINKSIMQGSPTSGAAAPGAWLRFSPEYVRCFCNLPACISTGYMCKSSGGGCFSEVVDQGDYKGLHGCLELLNDRNQKKRCENYPTTTTSNQKKLDSKSPLLCCYHDMCNHADSPETKVLLNNTFLGATNNETDNRVIENIGAKQDPALYTESEVWFRAATIAVPICGAVILLALILLAVKLLRTESSNNQSQKQKLGILPYSFTVPFDRKHCEKQQPAYQHHNIIHYDLFSKDSHHNPVYLSETEDVHVQSYVPLLLRDDVKVDCDKKNEANAKLNFIQDLGQCTETTTNCDDPKRLFQKNTDLHMCRNIVLENNLERGQDIVNKVYDKEYIS
ncbi:hypothetical protein FQR65_LT07198 [Abscondita terminalis]|nr:hypothetical protein FQR65_LT07198 [Abscondita terminalis]